MGVPSLTNGERNMKLCIGSGGLSQESVITRPEDLRTFSLGGEKHGKHSNLGWALDQLLGHCRGFLQGDGWKKKCQVFYPAFSHHGTTSRADSTEIAARKSAHYLPSTHSDSAAAKQREPFSFRITYNLLEDYTTEWRKYNDRMVRSRRVIGLRTPLVLFYESYEAGDITLVNASRLDEIILTNLDVMVHAITWAITLIADNKHVQHELHEEVNANRDNLQEYLPRSDTHLHRSFLETIRLQTPAILVKPGGEDSEDFRPSRFKNIKATDLRYNMAIFGFGSRKCPGQYVAAQGVKALLVHILRQYDIEVIKERTDGKSHDTGKAQVIPMADVIVRLSIKSNGR
ncbi:cytochrome P450 [Colletotrichum somersetense]|nr:cytochrome P450 [Colletotrichum somersetense]